MTQISLKYDDSGAQRLLSMLKKKGGDLSPVTSAISLLMHKDVIQRFVDEADHEGKPWPDLSPVTIARRKNKDKGTIKKLRDKGRLWGSIKSNKARSFGDNWAAVSTDIEYAAVHNFGYPKRNIKQRAFMTGISNSAHKKVFTLITKYLMEGI